MERGVAKVKRRMPERRYYVIDSDDPIGKEIARKLGLRETADVVQHRSAKSG